MKLNFARDTAFDPNAWTPDRPETGHCAVVALVVNDVHGGAIMRCIVGDQSHYFNRLPDGQIIDLTVAQFDTAPDYATAEERTREYLLSSEDTSRRYELLKSRTPVCAHDEGETPMPCEAGEDCQLKAHPAREEMDADELREIDQQLSGRWEK